MTSTRWVLASLYVVGVLTITIIGVWLASSPLPTTATVDQIAQPQKEALDLIIDIDKLLITWALLVIGAVAGGAVRFRDKLSNSYLVDVLMIAILLFSLASIYFGLLTFGHLLEMLSNSTLALDWEALLISRSAQYYSLLVSIVLLGGPVVLFGGSKAKA